jgi:two-component system, chemotaxis family, chemotaxis protein CheY
MLRRNQDLKTALIVDDSKFMRTMVSNILNKIGLQVVGEAQNGKEAIEKYQQLNPDLVLMDITMEEMNGIEALENIMRLNPRAKVIMCSSIGQQSYVIEAIKLGAVDFIVKPFNEERVREAVRKALSED